MIKMEDLLPKLEHKNLIMWNMKTFLNLLEMLSLRQKIHDFFNIMGSILFVLGGAVIANFTDGFGSEGASTITQQVVKNYFLTADKTISRKAQEAWLAIQLERKYTKEEIFELYVNKVFMSERTIGIATASRCLFRQTT